jgi:HD-GYP domain-containing protein (c-di-GMP phosphodiesterase class II)
MYSGCTADAEVAAEIFGGHLTTHLMPSMFGSRREALAGIARALPDPGGPVPVRALQGALRFPRAARQHKPHLVAACEVAQMLSRRVGLPASLQSLFSHLTERWDGKGHLRRAEGERIPLAIRVAHVARDAAFQRVLGGDEFAARITRERAGGAFDPQVANCLADHAGEILALDSHVSAWEETLASEPEPRAALEGVAIDRALAAMGDLADLVSPPFSGHSARTSALAAAAATRSGAGKADAAAIRRAGFVHDLGRIAISARIWQKPGPLTADEWEQVRLHPYHTERVLSRSPLLSSLAPIASAHHERLDGSGYHRGVPGAALGLPARMLAAADAYTAMTAPRPYRRALSPGRAAEEAGREASAGKLDADAVTAVLESAGQRVPRIERPAGLSDREAEVLALLAHGLQTKQVAGALGISAKTADRHVQNLYGKIGVSTRAAAALFAMEHGLAAWGELPIAERGGGS